MNRGFTAAMLGVLLVLTACAQGPAPVDSFYRMNLDAPPAPAAAALDGVLEVARFSADGLVAGRAILHSDAGSPHQIMEYDYHFWAEPPPIMVRDLLVAYLRDAGVAKQIVTPEMRVAPQYALGGKITRFEKVTGSASRVVIGLDVALRRVGDDRLLFVKTYAAEAPVADETVGTAVTTLNRILVELFAEIAGDLSRV